MIIKITGTTVNKLVNAIDYTTGPYLEERTRSELKDSHPWLYELLEAKKSLEKDCLKQGLVFSREEV